MKNTRYGLVLIAFLYLGTTIYSQPLSVGAYSGVSISDIHRVDISGKWSFKPGSAAGLYADYSLFGIFGVRTGIGFSSVYYERTTYIQSPVDIWQYYPSWSSYYDPLLYRLYLPQPEKMDFSFLTFPLELRLSIPSRPRIDLTGGVYYSVVQDHSLNYYYGNYEGLQEKDMGYRWSAALVFPVRGDINLSLGATYNSGRTKFLDYGSYRHGHIDIAAGLSYDGFIKKRRGSETITPETDSLSSRLSVIYSGGVSININTCQYLRGKYSPATGFTAGFMLNFRWAPRSSFMTGLAFNRTGFALKDSSSVFFRYVPKGNPMYSVETKTGIDYITIPAMLNLYFGKRNRIYFNTGPWLGFKLNARVTGKATREERSGYEFSVTELTVYDDIDAVVRDTDVGWMAGTGFIVPVGKHSGIDLGISYSRGLHDLYDRSYYNSTTPVDTYLSVMRNSSISLHAGIIIPAK